jgi:TolB-like protein/Tfp pilus assembly protein PilF
VRLRSYEFGPFRLDVVRQQLWEGEAHRDLTPKAYDLLLHLLERPGELLEKQTLLDGVWPDVVVGDSVLKVRIGELRKVLRDDPAEPRFIETAHRKGYRFLGKVNALGADPTAEGALPEALAVTVFENRGEDSALDYLSEGIASAVCSRLSALGRLPVIAFSSSAALDETQFDAGRWGEQLGARYLVRGSVQKVDDRIRVRAELIDAEDGTARWGERYERPLADVRSLEDEIAEQVGCSVGRRLFDPLPHHRERLDSDSFDAYDALLRGSYFQRRQTKGTAGQARACYEEALAIDANLVHAHYGMAISHAFDLMNLTAGNPAESAAKLFMHARRCVEIDEEWALGHAVSGFGCAMIGQRDQAERFLRRAISLDRNLPGPHNQRGFLRVLGGRPEEGLAHLAEAVRLSPLDPELWLTLLGQAVGECMAGRPEAAIKRARESLAQNPLWQARLILTMSQVMKGDLEGAREECEALQAAKPGLTIATVWTTMPSAIPEVRARFAELLGKAGLPA